MIATFQAGMAFAAATFVLAAGTADMLRPWWRCGTTAA
jgi:hypothetical protein